VLVDILATIFTFKLARFHFAFALSVLRTGASLSTNAAGWALSERRTVGAIDLFNVFESFLNTFSSTASPLSRVFARLALGGESIAEPSVVQHNMVRIPALDLARAQRRRQLVTIYRIEVGLLFNCFIPQSTTGERRHDRGSLSIALARTAGMPKGDAVAIRLSLAIAAGAQRREGASKRQGTVGREVEEPLDDEDEDDEDRRGGQATREEWVLGARGERFQGGVSAVVAVHAARGADGFELERRVYLARAWGDVCGARGVLARELAVQPQGALGSDRRCGVL
jgi:hypothetical protein